MRDPDSTPDQTGIMRPATAADEAEVLALIREYYTYDEIPFHGAEMASGLRELLGDPALGRVFLILSDRQTAGYAIVTWGFDLEFGGRQGTVTDLYLRSEFRRKRLGERAFALIEKVSAELGMASLQLQPERDNVEARAFYAKLGFREHDRVCLSKRLELPP